MTRPQKGTKETRTVFSEVRVGSQGDEMALVGYAASYNVLSQDLGGYRECIAPGAFTRSLASGADVHCLFNHDPNQVLGRTKSGTLTLTDTPAGLCFNCALNPNSSAHRDVHAAVKRGDIDQCSFAFIAGDDDSDDWSDDVDENGVRFAKRTLRNVTLMDVSAVTYPAYNGVGATGVSARSLPQYRGADFDKYIRRRAEEIRRIIAHDDGNVALQTYGELLQMQIDSLTREEAKRIGRQIQRDEIAQREEDDLRRRMQLAAGRLVK